MRILWKKNTRLFVVISVIAIITIGAYMLIQGSKASGEITQKTNFLMDTAVQIQAVGTNVDDSIAKAFNEMQRIENLFSRYIEDSDVSRINKKSGSWVDVQEETMNLIDQGNKLGEVTDGAFDIAIGKLIDLWGFSSREYRVPLEKEIIDTLDMVDYRKIELNKDTNQVRVPKGMVLDLGGIAKGYAVDRAAHVLRNEGVSHGLVNAGGDIVTIGGHPNNNHWRVGVQDPRDTTTVLAVIHLKDKSVVTSGDYQRFFVEDEVRFHHIIDPKKGYPASEVTSVTIVSDTAMESDSLSTGVFVLGYQLGSGLIESLANVEGLIVDKDGNVWVSSGLKQDISL